MSNKTEIFKTDAERQLWIKLNAERQIAWEKTLTYYDSVEKIYKPTLQALHPRSMEEAMEISARQCEGDEEKGSMRYTLEELLTLDIEGLNAISDKRHQDWCKQFEALD